MALRIEHSIHGDGPAAGALQEMEFRCFSRLILPFFFFLVFVVLVLDDFYFGGQFGQAESSDTWIRELRRGRGSVTYGIYRAEHKLRRVASPRCAPAGEYEYRKYYYQQQWTHYAHCLDLYQGRPVDLAAYR